MALFTDKRELPRQPERVPMQLATGGKKVGMAIAGFRDDGTRNTFGQIVDYAPIPGLSSIQHGFGDAITKDDTDYGDVIKRGGRGAIANDLEKLNFAAQAFKIYLALGGNVGGEGGGGAAGSSTAGATATPTTGTPVTSGTSGIPAGSGTAVPVDPGQMAQVSGASTWTPSTGGLESEMSGVAANMNSMTPTYNTASWTQGPAMDAGGNIVDMNILDEMGELTDDPTTSDKILDYLNTHYDGEDGRVGGDVDPTTGVTSSGEEYNIIGPDVMGRKGSGTGSGKGSDMFKDLFKKGKDKYAELSPKQKEALKTNIADTQAALNAKGPKGAESDYKNWVEAVKQNGYRAVGQNAVDNQGNIVATYDVSDKEKDEANMRMKNAAGSMVSTGSGIVGATMDMISGSTANIRDAEDRADEYRNQKSITQSYLL